MTVPRLPRAHSPVPSAVVEKPNTRAVALAAN